MKQSKVEHKKELILQKGIEIMWEKGYNATGIQEVVNAAGVPKGSFYAYFKSKENFAIEALNYFSLNYYQEENLMLENREEPPVKRFEEVLNKRIEAASALAECNNGCFISNISQEMAAVSSDIAKEVVGITENMMQGMIVCFEEGIASGEIGNDHDSVELAKFVDASWKGALMAAKAYKNIEPLELCKKYLLNQIKM